MIGHKLPNKTKSVTVAEPKTFHQLNRSLVDVARIGLRVPSLQPQGKGLRKDS
jgi:hypothetical protein